MTPQSNQQGGTPYSLPRSTEETEAQNKQLASQVTEPHAAVSIWMGQPTFFSLLQTCCRTEWHHLQKILWTCDRDGKLQLEGDSSPLPPHPGCSHELRGLFPNG